MKWAPSTRHQGPYAWVIAAWFLGCGGGDQANGLFSDAGWSTRGGNAGASGNGGGAGGSTMNGGRAGRGGSPVGGAAGATSSGGGADAGGGVPGTGGATTDDAGAGGASSGGGAPDASSGGSTGTGGVAGSGGATNTGGAVAAGGAMNTGGTAAAGGATSTGGAVAAGGATGTGGCPNGSFPGAGSSTGFSVPMPIPTVLAPTSVDATTDHYTISVRTGTAQMRAGNVTPIVGFNGSFPGPTIVATKGRRVQVTQINNWNENVTVHNHGHKVAAASDGHPIDYVVPGAQKIYTYPNDQLAATYWYHDHAMDLTGAHVYAGLAAFYLIHDPAEDALGLPSGGHDVPMLIQDKSFNSDNSLRYDDSPDNQGFMGDTAVVNGVVTPYLEVSTHKYRFRILNGSSSRNFRLRLASGRAFQVIASDGGLLTAPVTLTSLNVAPAERYDVVVDFGQYMLGARDVLTNADQEFPQVGALVQFRVTRSECDSSAVPGALASIARLSTAQAAGTRRFTFDQDRQDWTINGLTYDPARIDVTSTLDSVYVWELDNQSGEMHPFHKHLAEFQILDIDGNAPPPEQRGWKDTVAVPSRGSARIIFRNETFTGTYVFHCHRLEHEDHRMMLQEAVVP